MKKTLISLCAVAALLFTGCGSETTTVSSSTTTAATSKTAFDIDTYKNLVIECQTEINDAALILSNTGSYQVSFWETLGELSDEMVDRSFEWLSENSDDTRQTVDAAYDSIRNKYKNITLIEVEGNEGEEIQTHFEKLYETYNTMYLQVTSPSGTISTFASEFSDSVSGIIDSDADLCLFLGVPSTMS